MATVTQEREQLLSTLREKALKETERAAQKQRFGLFTQPPPLGIGDDSYDKRKIPARNPDTGKPITENRNFQVSAPKQGKTASSYFQLQSFVSIGDKYIEQERVRKQDELKNKKLMGDVEFKPASTYKVLVNGAYEHKSDFNDKKKNYRNAEGKVITSPANIVNNPGDKALYKFRQHMVEPYDRAKELQKKEREQHYAKIADKPVYKSTIYGQKPFNNDKKAYGEDVPQPVKKNPKPIDFHIMKHETTFKPSNPPKTGHEGYLNKYPPYMSDPIREAKRLDLVSGKAKFKINHPGAKLTRPTDSIVCHPINIRREMANIHHKL